MGHAEAIVQAPLPARRGTRPLYSLVPQRAAKARLCPLVARLLRCRRCSLLLAESSGDLLIEESVGLPRELVGTVRVPIGTGIAGRVAQDGRPLIVNGPADRAGLPKPAGSYLSDAFISYPFRLPNGTIGVINATEREDGRPFGADDLEAVEQLAAFFATTFDASARREARRLRQELRSVLRHAIRAQDAERLRLARELHDDTGHLLTAAILRLDMADARVGDDAAATEALALARDVLVDCADHLHDVAFQLGPRVLIDLGLGPALRSLARRARQAKGIEATVEIHGNERRLADESELTVFRIAQEAMTNALKHAMASRVSVRLTFTDDAIDLEVVDDGIGFSPSPADVYGDRYCQGLQGMRERAELAGGLLEVHSRGGGTTVQARLPIGVGS